MAAGSHAGSAAATKAASDRSDIVPVLAADIHSINAVLPTECLLVITVAFWRTSTEFGAKRGLWVTVIWRIHPAPGSDVPVRSLRAGLRYVQTLFATLREAFGNCPRNDLSIVAREPFEGRSSQRWDRSRPP
jgi:hypothetical protein